MAAKNPAAVSLGRKGGRATSAAKSAAARMNGAKGGRPARPRPIVVHVPSATFPDRLARWEHLKASAVHQAWFYMMHNHGSRCYLYYDAAKDGRWGAFYVVPESDNTEWLTGLFRVTTETVPTGDKQAIALWLDQHADPLPMIGDDQ